MSSRVMVCRRSRTRIYLNSLLTSQRTSCSNLCQLPPERHAFAGYKEWESRLGAAVAVVDAVAVADPEVSLGAEHPDRLLQEAGEKRWAVGTESAGVDAPRRLLDDAGTTTRPIARRSIPVLGAETAQRTRSVQPIVHQRVDRHHTGAGCDPALPRRISAKQEVGKRHRQDLARHAVNAAERLKKRLSHQCRAIRSLVVGRGKPRVDPGDEVAVTDISEKEE